MSEAPILDAVLLRLISQEQLRCRLATFPRLGLIPIEGSETVFYKLFSKIVWALTMIDITIPGFGRLQLEHLVLDYNGTLAVDGQLVEGVSAKLLALDRALSIHVITADTFGGSQKALEAVPCTFKILGPNRQAEGKRDYLRLLGPSRSVAVGNGRNDRLMLEEAALGIGVILDEGVFGGIFESADVVCKTIVDALDLLDHPLRLTATLRS